MEIGDKEGRNGIGGFQEKEEWYQGETAKLIFNIYSKDVERISSIYVSNFPNSLDSKRYVMCFLNTRRCPQQHFN